MNDSQASIEHAQGRVSTADDLELAFRSWTGRETRGVISLVHGLAEHSGRYGDTGRYLAGKGWAVFAIDLRGHGQSPDGHKPGRVHIKGFGDYGLDVDALRAVASERFPDLPQFLLGHSMGGLIALNALLDKPAKLLGGIISSPALAPHPDALPPRHIRWMAQLLSLIAPRKMFPSDLDPQMISRDPDVVRAYIEDPLVTRQVSARWYISVLKAMAKTRERAAELKVPILLMQSGEDRLVDPAAPGDWAGKAQAGKVEFQSWDGFYHEMLNEPEKDRVRNRIIDWLDQRLERTTGKKPELAS